MKLNLIQLQKGSQRRVARVDEPRIWLLDEEVGSVLALVNMSLEGGATMEELVGAASRGPAMEYEPIYSGKSEWKVLSPIDHVDVAHCIISGTGLTHLGSAKNRDAMHEKAAATTEQLTDSMKMFRWGAERGKPAAGEIGTAPEWFYKGTAANLRAHGEALEVPAYAEDGGEEAEIAGIYVIDRSGNPHRIGMAQGNEFSDHVFEKKNYLNLAGSKLRTCSIGPELVIAPDFSQVPGTVSIHRAGKVIWSKPIATGESEMSHSLANIEHHHFKFAAHRQPGDLHIHFFGASALSFGEGIKLENGDLMQVHFENFGRPLLNPLRIDPMPDKLVSIIPIR